MNRVLILIALLGSLHAQVMQQGVIKSPQPAGGGGGTFTLTQFKFRDGLGAGTGGGACAFDTTSCIVNASAIGAGHLAVICSLMGQTGAGGTMSAPTANGQTWVHCGGTNGCAFGSIADGNTDCWYTLNSASNAATTQTCNFSVVAATDTYNSCMLWEFSYSGASVSFDTSNGGIDSSCITCASPAMSITGNPEVILQLALSIPATTGVTAWSDATYTSPTAPIYSNTGTTGKINATSYTAGNWTVSPATATVVLGVAFKGN